MTTRYTNAEWTSIIADFERDIDVEEGSHPGPTVGRVDVDLAKTIDHSLLKLDATSRQIDELCAEARVAGFATVCIRPNHVAQAAADLKGSEIRVATVIGFHEGTYDLPYKLHETCLVLEAGAHELDVVINRPQLKHGEYNTIYNELAAIRSIAPPPTLLKLIFETSQLSRHQIIAACVIAGSARFDFVKSSTGFQGHGARVQDVRLMSAVCAMIERRGIARMEVQASGGIRTLKDANDMIDAGASRLGTSAGMWIVKEVRESVQGGSFDDGANRPGLGTRLFTDY